MHLCLGRGNTGSPLDPDRFRLADTQPATKPNLLKRILLGRCPNCGAGPLFEGFLKAVPRCRVCGATFPSDASADGPAFFIMLVAGFVVVGGILFTELAYTPPWWVHVLIWGPATLILCVAPLRPLKALFITLQFQHDAQEGREDTPSSGVGRK